MSAPTRIQITPTVFHLLDEPAMGKLHVVGRLDLDTTGLVLITDDGQVVPPHHLAAPRVCQDLSCLAGRPRESEEAISLFEDGVYLRNETDKTRPAQLEILGECEARLTIHEGKYHQVKRMFAAIGNKVIGLHRERIGALGLDDQLAPGEYRELTAEEVAQF